MTQKRFVASVWRKLLLYSAPLFTRGDVVLTGFSGGPDSVCLLHFLNYLAGKKGFTLLAAHVNHGLRGADALADARFARAFCKERKIRFLTKKISVKSIAKQYGLSPEHAARKGRYRALAELAAKAGATKLALGHHLDDHAETVLLHLLRGTKAKGLAGIVPRRALNARVEIVRPLLCVRRKDVEDYLKYNALPSVTDQTNFDDAFTRNWVRSRLLPLLESKQPQIREHLALLAEDVAAQLEERPRARTKTGR